VLERHGALDGTHRQRRPAPPKGWHLPALAQGQAELDSFDFIEDLKIAGGPLVSVLTATSLHGALADAWVVEHPSAKATLEALTDRWRREGLPTYAQFDNDTIFQGAHQFTDTVGRVSRLCLALQVIPVFAPPREHGFQNAIEGFNALWQSKVWQRHHCPDLASLVAVSERYIIAYRVKTAARREAAPNRRRFPKGFKLNLNTPLKGTMIYLRRSDDQGNVPLLAKPSLSLNTGVIAWCAARWTSPISASASMPCAAAIPITSHCFARYLTFVPTNHFRASHERSINAETLSRRCQTSVQLTLKLAR
jgi:hypothetical protein